MTKDYDSMIIDNESKLNSVLQQMESTKDLFLQKIVEFSQSWYQENAKREITKHPEIAKNIGTDRLKEIKDDVNKLVEDTPKFIKDYLDKDEIWWHKKQDLITGFYNSNRLPKDMDKLLRVMLGEKLASILSVDGFIKTKSSDRDDYTVWTEILSYGAYGKQVMYPYSINLPRETMSVLKQYYDLINEAKNLKEAIDNLKQEKEETSVSDIWDSL